MTDGRQVPAEAPSPSSDPSSGDVGSWPVAPLDATVALRGLARTMARLHEGRLAVPEGVVVEALTVSGVVARAEGIVAELEGLASDGASVPMTGGAGGAGAAAEATGSPYGHLDRGRLLDVLKSGAAVVEERCGGRVVTIGRATVANLVLTSAIDDATFRVWGDAASADPYRDLAAATASVVSSFGPGAVLGFMDAYAAARPAVEPLDLVRLDWWSLAVDLMGRA